MRKGRRVAPHDSTARATSRAVPWALIGLLAAFLGFAYGFGLQLAFVNDDYFFLDKVWHASFLDLWTPQDLLFNWYRPWSRELHYWALFHLAGFREPAYHLANFVLWLGVMTLYFALVRRLVGESAAIIASAGLAALALWGSPILWIAGAQELWMLAFALAC